MPPTEFVTTLPPRPRAVLRLGFAGHRTLTDAAQDHLLTGLRLVLTALGERLASLAPGTPPPAAAPAPWTRPRVADYFAPDPPLLRLVTGLCEGADTVAARVLADLTDTPGALPAGLRTELAAVLPFDPATYRASRPADFRPEFDAQAQRCAYIVTADGHYARPDPDTAPAAARRAKAYRAQSALLLRQADVLIAAADPGQPGLAGGTLETVQAALALQRPVVFIHTVTGAIRLIDPDADPVDDLDSTWASPAPTGPALTAVLHGLVADCLIGPDPDAVGSGLEHHFSQRRSVRTANPTIGPRSVESAVRTNDPAASTTSEIVTKAAWFGAGADDGAGDEREGQRLLHEYFAAPHLPPRATWRGRAWRVFEWLFADGTRVPSDPRLRPYAAYRDRATGLNYYYAGLYRGAFVLNYVLAVAAVLLATLSLVLIATAAGGAAETLPALTATAGPELHAIVADQAGGHGGGLLPVLLGLGLLKLAIVGFIARNTHGANRGRWSDLAVDYRYLAERLRALYYLPLTGSFQPPAATPPQSAARLTRQSTVDWLFNAIARGLSPADLEATREERVPTHDGTGTLRLKVLRLDPAVALARVRDHWIGGQVAYHARNARTMGNVGHLTERAGTLLSQAVVLIVAGDLVLLGLHLGHWLPAGWSARLHQAAPWLLFLTALLPAAVAALNGLRFQSECRRLAERSATLRVILGGRPAAPGLVPVAIPGVIPTEPDGGRWRQAADLGRRIALSRADSDQDPGAWSLETLWLAERVAGDCIREVAEWSVLYAKELPET